ncbi:hypothetical protein ACJJTC_007288 [Scirpophaga incertulas]
MYNQPPPPQSTPPGAAPASTTTPVKNENSPESADNTQVSDQTLKSLWLARMPASVRAVIAVCQDQSLDNLAQIADKVLENTRYHEIGTISNQTPATSSGSLTEIIGQMNKLMLEVAS